MAEHFGKVIQKKTDRAKQLLKQKYGGADKTPDEEFDLYTLDFNNQQDAVTKIHKNLKSYHLGLKALASARRNLIETLNELYEENWVGNSDFHLKSEEQSKHLEDFCEKIIADLVSPVGSYLLQFPEINKKIQKRKRKLLDLDSAQSHLHTVEAMKKPEKAKIDKARENKEEALKNFVKIDRNLREELPALYNSRVVFFSSTLQSLFVAEMQYSEKNSAYCNDLIQILESLESTLKDTSVGKLTKRVAAIEPSSASSCEPEDKGENCESAVTSGSIGENSEMPTDDTIEARNSENLMKSDERVNESEGSLEKAKVKEKIINEENQAPLGSIGESTDTLNYHVLYQVKSIFKYSAEDTDELSFNIGDIIDVVAYDDPEEQEEGWLMGIFQEKKGLFPANFTVQI